MVAPASGIRDQRDGNPHTAGAAPGARRTPMVSRPRPGVGASAGTEGSQSAPSQVLENFAAALEPFSLLYKYHVQPSAAEVRSCAGYCVLGSEVASAARPALLPVLTKCERSSPTSSVLGTVTSTILWPGSQSGDER